MYSQQLINLLEGGINEKNMAWFHEEFLPVVVRRLSILSDQEHEVFLLSGTFLYSFLCSESDAASYLYNKWGQVNKYDFATPPEVCYYLIKYRKLQLASPDARKFNEVKVVDPRAGWLTKFEADVDYTKRINFKTQTFHIGKSNADNAKMAQIMHRNYKRALKFNNMEQKRLELIEVHQHFVRDGGEFVDVRKMYDQYIMDYFYEGKRGSCETDIWFMNMNKDEGVYHGVAYNPGLVLPIRNYRRNDAFEHYLDLRFQDSEGINVDKIPDGCMIDTRGVCVFEQVDQTTIEQIEFDEEDNYVYDYEEERIDYDFDPITFTGEFESHMLNKLREIFADEKVQNVLRDMGLKDVSIVSTKVAESTEDEPPSLCDDEVQAAKCSGDVSRPLDLNKGALLVGVLAAVTGFTPKASAVPYRYNRYRSYVSPYSQRSYTTNYGYVPTYLNTNFQTMYYDYFQSLDPSKLALNWSEYSDLVRRSSNDTEANDLNQVVKIQPYRSDLMLNSTTAEYFHDSSHEGVQDRRVVDSSAANVYRLSELSYGLGIFMWFACGFL